MSSHGKSLPFQATLLALSTNVSFLLSPNFVRLNKGTRIWRFTTHTKKKNKTFSRKFNAKQIESVPLSILLLLCMCAWKIDGKTSNQVVSIRTIVAIYSNSRKPKSINDRFTVMQWDAVKKKKQFQQQQQQKPKPFEMWSWNARSQWSSDTWATANTSATQMYETTHIIDDMISTRKLHLWHRRRRRMLWWILILEWKKKKKNRSDCLMSHRSQSLFRKIQ